MQLPKGRIPAAVVSVAVVVGLVVAASVVVGAAVPGVAFAQAGHWVFNRSENAVVHVDSGTRAVDARVTVPEADDDPAFAVQGATQGFLVGRRNITVFGKSSLTVETTLPSGQTELPVGIETVGGPYLVYQHTGTIVRLGVPPMTIPVGGPVSRPVYTDDGTLWVQRTDDGQICSLSAGATSIDCAVSVQAGTPGALSIAQAAAGFVSLADDAVQIVGSRDKASPVGLGVDLPGETLIADRDSENRLPVVMPNPARLVLADDSGVLMGKAGGAPITVELGQGSFSGPVAADGVVALIDLTRHRLLTFAMDGRPLGAVDLPPGDDSASIMRGGDGRLYVDDSNGSKTHVVAKDGTIASIATGVPSDTAVSAQPPEISAVMPVLSTRASGGGVTSTVGGGGGGATSGPSGSGGGQAPSGPPLPGPPLPGPLPPPPPVSGPPGAPLGLRLTKDGSEGMRQAWLELAWSPPDLNGGTLKNYVVQVTGESGAPVTKTTTATEMKEIWMDRCAGPFVLTVKAVTSVGGRTLTGPAASVTSSSKGGCSLNFDIAARATGSTTASVTLTQNAPIDPGVSGGCSLQFGERTVWSGRCGGSSFAVNSSQPVPVTGLEPGTTYSVVLRVDQLDGSTTSATDTVTTQAIAKTVPEDVNGDGSVDCADVQAVKSQWGQTGPGHSGDVNKSGKVDITDLSMVLSKYDGPKSDDPETSCQ